MRYFSPRFQIATLAPPQTKLQSKIGGLPWGLPAKLWPTCCGHPQKLLAQLLHEPPMLDLGDKNAVLHLFQCLECFSLDPSGPPAFLVDRSDLGDHLVTIDDYDFWTLLPGRNDHRSGSPLIGELFIAGWDQRDDGIPASRLQDFYNEEKLFKLEDEFPQIDWFNSRQSTKFGGSPRWTGNGPRCLDFPMPPHPFEFLFQLDTAIHIDGPPPAADDVGCAVTRHRYESLDKGAKPITTTQTPTPGKVRINAPWDISYLEPSPLHAFNEHVMEYTNFGSDGTAYVFINRTVRPHKVKWFWNR